MELTNMELKLELAPVQRDVLTALVNLQRERGQAIKGEEIAELVGRHPGTIRNQMHSLRDLNLVQGFIGPKGGYKATASAYDALSMEIRGDGDEIEVPVIKNGMQVKGVSVREIILNKVTQPKTQCNGIIRIIGDIRDFDIGDEIEIGPTPANKILVRGKVVGLDNPTSSIILDITEMISIPRLPVKKVARRAVRISPNTSLKEASRILNINGAQEALVEDRSPGLINLVDITRAVAEGRTDLEVREIMTCSFLIINSEELIFEAIKMLAKTGASQLVVLDNGVLWGIITPGNLIEALMPA